MSSQTSLETYGDRAVGDFDALSWQLREICRHLPCHFGAIGAMEAQGSDTIMASWDRMADRSDLDADTRQLIIDGLRDVDLNEQEIVVVGGSDLASQLPQWNDLLHSRGITTAYFIPLVCHDQRQGVCILYGSDKEVVPDVAVAALRVAQASLAASIVSRLHVERLIQEIGEQKQIAGELQEVVDQQMGEGALRASELKYRTLVEASPYCIKLIDADGHLLSMNRAGLRMLGEKDEKDIVGRNYMQAVCAADYERIYPYLQASLKGETTEFEFRASVGPYFRANLVPILDNDGKVHRLLGVTEDITLRKQDEAARQQLEQRTRQAQKMEAIGKLAGGVAHDFNNFLTVILGNTELLLASMDQATSQDKQSYERLSQIYSAGSSAAAVAKQLLTFSRKDISEPEIIDVKVVAPQMLSLLRRLIGENYDLALEVGDTPLLIKADRGLLDQVLLNLVNNAADAMPEGGQISIAVSSDEFTRDDSKGEVDFKPGKYVTLCVTDEGTGISEDDVDRIFEPFFTTKPLKGTGLGLSTAQAAVERLGGRITFETDAGSGSAFTVYIPSATMHEDRDNDNFVAPHVKADSNKVVLVCEDEEHVREVISAKLRIEGYTVLEASSGDEALAIAGECDRLDMLITDVLMPKMSGPQLSKQLCQQMPDLVVIFVSGYTSELVDEDLLGTQVGFLQKPFALKKLLEKMHVMLSA